MALSNTRIRDQIIAQIQVVYGFTFTPAQKVEAEKLWGLVNKAIVDEIKGFADLSLASVKVNPGTLVANITTGVITGQGDTVAGTQTAPRIL